jgi:hypothetical protein
LGTHDGPCPASSASATPCVLRRRTASRPGLNGGAGPSPSDSAP